MRARAVIGANYGDEGKGLMVDYLCSQGAGVVVRFNGGAQAGHTVVTPDGQRHVFQHFGSGSFLGVPTFLSQFFVCHPIQFFREAETLAKLGVDAPVYAHPDCLVTTFADMMINQALEDARGDKRHGSVGMGFNETIERSSVPELRITMADLWNRSPALEEKLVQICGSYSAFRTGKPIADPGEMIERFMQGCWAFAEAVHPAGIGQCKDPVFEGAQGLLLDQDSGGFPHVTRSNTGMKNVRSLCAQAGIDDVDVYYVSRTYLTRHGAGPLTGEDAGMSYADHTNLPHPYQGKIRFAPMDAGLRDRCAKDAGGAFSLVLTHCDQRRPDVAGDLYSFGPTRDDVKVGHE